jgi:hypothetical protein
VAPNEPQSYVSAFIEPTLRRALEDAAREHDRSLSGELRVALRAYLAEPEQRETDHALRRRPRRGCGR